MAILYAKGTGVPQSYEMAYMWFTLCVSNSESSSLEPTKDKAVEFKDKAGAYLSSQQKEKVQKAVLICIESNYEKCIVQ